MSLNFISEVWECLRFHLDPSERTLAAEDLINLLIDNDYEASEIKQAFSGDKDIISALKSHADQEAEYDDWNDDDFDNLDDDSDEWQ
jgi:hypothetical protein